MRLPDHSRRLVAFFGALLLAALGTTSVIVGGAAAAGPMVELAIGGTAGSAGLAQAVRISPPSSGPVRFATLAAGSVLPSGAQCAGWVRARPENRPQNAVYNQRRGVSAHNSLPRVDGNFVGTTDEILQWVACKWGVDEDLVRSQAVIESWWDQRTGGDPTSTQSSCYPDVRTSSGTCPESVGLLQVRYLYHSEAFENGNALYSSAYNADYAYGYWRECFEGRQQWLNTVERGRTYAAGDALGCMGAWFAGRWYTSAATGYMDRLSGYRTERTWEQPYFNN